MTIFSSSNRKGVHLLVAGFVILIIGVTIQMIVAAWPEPTPTTVVDVRIMSVTKNQSDGDCVVTIRYPNGYQGQASLGKDGVPKTLVFSDTVMIVLQRKIDHPGLATSL